ncbi:MAG: DUF4145 domain-containing protein, partial [Flavobacterium sp.]|nr:DUF4145 domain-containing protein [Flavobacterium sp.]
KIMAFNRKIWLSWKPKKPCPTCNTGTLDFPNDKYILKTETASSREMETYGGNYYSDYVFSMHLKCNNCDEVVAVTGLRSEENYPSNEEVGLQHSIIPISFYPALKIIEIPNSCPKSVKKVLNESFGLYWLDISSCANKIRIAIEVLLNELNVPDANGTKKLTLHKRLEEFEKTNSDTGNLLLAIKWIGNAGSHYSGLKNNDVLDAYELLEFALEKLYNDREKKLIQLSQEINKNKNPLKK